MAQETTEKLTLQNSGDHHQTLISIDPNTGKIAGGTIFNFSNNSAVGLTLANDGKTSGTIAHAGDTHSFMATASSDGDFKGEYSDKKTGIDLNISGGIATLTKGKIPQLGISQEGDHHKTILSLSEDGKLSGILESHSTDNNGFRVELQNGRISSGSFVHKGENHETNITLSQDGWKATVAGGSGNSRWAIGVEKGNAEMKVKGNLDIKF